MKQRMRLPASACLLAAVLAGGCAVPPAHLDFSPTPATAETSLHATTKLEAPRVYLAPIEDLRLDKENIGQVGGRPYSGSNIMPWLEQQLHDQVAAHVRLVAADSSPAMIVHPRLHKLYVDGLSVTKSAIIVLELAFTTPDGTTSHRNYRGQYAAMNWWNSEAEMKTALGLALKDCLAHCGPDMNARTKLSHQAPASLSN